MFIQTETTPNPHTIKFLPGRTVMEKGTAVFIDLEEAKKESPLAASLLEMEEVTGVFFGADFVSVTKAQAEDWAMVKPLVLTTIMEHFVNDQPVLMPKTAGITSNDASEEDSEVVREIKELIETRVRPAVAQDGGDIVYRDYRDGIVYLELHGACSGCPSSTVTLKNGIENMLKHYVPEVMAVEAIM